MNGPLDQVASWPVRTAAVAVMSPAGLLAARGPLDRPFSWASVTKLLTTLAALDVLSPSLVDSELLAEATRTAFPGLPGVVPGFGRQPLCDWGLGFEIRDSKAPHWTGSRNSPATFGHFGRSGSFLWVDPEAGLACAALTDQDFGPWAARAWPRLSDDILTSYGSGLPVAGGQAQQVGDVHRPHL